ncbi:MAG: DUF6580 family putative transport protein [Porticoccaceae bacterium]
MKRHQTLFLIAAIVLAALTRLLPHPPNFSPAVALALFGGAVLANRSLALAVALGSMLLADLVLGFHNTMVFVYVAMALVVIGGGFIRHQRAPLYLTGAGFAAAVAFFVISNAGVWLMGNLYPRDGSGLVACYIAALPFFHNTLLSTLLYGALLFSAERLVVGRVRPAYG